MTQSDLDAARQELAGETVAVKQSGVPYDHLTEVMDAQRGLLKRIAGLRGLIAAGGLGGTALSAAQAELSRASSLLDYTEQFVPRL